MSAINFRNKQIFYRVEGCGKPVILLHGFGEDGNIWNNQIEALKQDHQLIIPDLPGSGQSEILEGDCEIENYTEVVKALADKEISGNSYKDFTLIGHSMGGYISLAFAKKYPGLLNALGLFHSSAFADNEEKIKARKKNIEFIEKNGAKPFLKSTIPNLFSKNTKDSHPEMVQELIRLSENLSPEALIQYTKAMIRREDTTSVLKSFPKPILFIVGIHDEAVPLEASLNQCYLPKIAQVNFLQKSGHLGMWEQQELATKFLKGFLTFADSFG